MDRKRGLAFPPSLVACIAVVGLSAPAADATKGSCVPGNAQPKCTLWKAKVKSVKDGDTVKVAIKKGKRFGKPQNIDLAGIQAMEMSKRKRECHAGDAADRLKALVLNKKVRLSAQLAGRNRSLAFKKGGWRDVGSLLVAEGHALWAPNAKEWAWNNTYARLSQFAARAGDGIWDTDSCGAGPNAALRLKVKWDAESSDGGNPNGEFVRISNSDPANAVSLAGWWVRDSSQRRYRFPAGTVVPAGGAIELHVGNGPSAGGTYHWGQARPVFENATGGSKGIGDGAYLFDPQGDLRYWQVYPCSVGCDEPLQGKVGFTAQPKSPESVQISNISSGPIDLFEYEVESVPWFYEFRPGTVLQPGQAITLFVQRDPAMDTQFVKGWGFGQSLFADGGDVVTLRNPLGGPVVCAAWGGKNCPNV
jgi:endonuclease YncB( thermonuclease family)